MMCLHQGFFLVSSFLMEQLLEDNNEIIINNKLGRHVQQQTKIAVHFAINGSFATIFRILQVVLSLVYTGDFSVHFCRTFQCIFCRARARNNSRKCKLAAISVKFLCDLLP